MNGQLADAVSEWQTALLSTTADFLTPDEVISAINDITIATLTPQLHLPVLLRSLYVDAVDRNKRGRESFSIIGLRHRAEKMLESIEVVAA